MKAVEILKTIAACDLNIGRCKQQDEWIKVYEYLRSRSFLDFGQRSLVLSILKFVFYQKPLDILAEFVCKL